MGIDVVLGAAALVLAALSAGVAVWQGRISREQLKLAQDTEARTERALEEIKRVTAETRQISQDVKNSIDDRITKIIDSRIQTEQAQQANSAAMSNAFMQKIMEGMGQKPPQQ